MHIRSKDTVVVITGKDKGSKGKVLVASPKTGKIVVEGVAVATKHQKPRQQGVPGGIIKKEAAIDASNVMLVCPKCGKGTASATACWRTAPRSASARSAARTSKRNAGGRKPWTRVFMIST